MTIRAIAGRVISNPVDRESGIDPRWSVYYNNQYRATVAIDNIGPVDWYNLNAVVVSNQVVSLTGSFNIGVESWEEDFDCGSHLSYDDCGFLRDDDDEYCGLTNTTVGSVGMMQPGQIDPMSAPASNVFVVTCGIYQLRLLVTYTPSQPSAPAILINGRSYTAGSSVCQSAATITLETTNAMSSHLSLITYTWEYNLGGETFDNWIPNPAACPGFCEDLDPLSPRPECCNEPRMIVEDPPPLRWRSIAGTTNAATNGGQKEFLLASIPGVPLLTSNTNIIFRLTASVGSVAGSPSPPGNMMLIAPPPPQATSILPAASCTMTNSGTIAVSGVTSLPGNFRYLLKAGRVSDAGCDPAVDGSCLNPQDISGTASGSAFQISGVAPGWFTLFLLNNAGMQGFCPRHAGEIEIPAIPALEITTITTRDVDCHGAANGEVALGTRNGQFANVNYTLVNQTTQQLFNAHSSEENAMRRFNGIAPGQILVTVTDHCTPPASRSVVIRQPARLSESSAEVVASTCNDPGNGLIHFTAQRSTGPFDVPASARLRFVLYKDGQFFDSQESTSLTYSKHGLPVGNTYELIATEVNGNTCNGVWKSFSIAGPPAIGVSDVVVTPVTCFGASTGAVNVRGTGRETFVYQLTPANGAHPFQNDTGSFEGLPSGVYQLLVADGNGCHDNYASSSSLVIDQPTLMELTIEKEDMLCYDEPGGSVSVTATGASPPFNYAWEAKLGTGSWAQMSHSSPSIDRLRAGTYRVRVRDTGQCESLSDEIVVSEPAELSVNHVNVSDILCFEGTGRIAASALGGVEPYQFLFSRNEGSYQPFDSTSALEEGRYRIMVKDNNGCTQEFSGEPMITKPDEPLTLSNQTSNFNGYNISCYGGRNGTVQLDAGGGNGGQYRGYEYRLNEGTWRTSGTFSNLAAGEYLFHVRDGRGCEIGRRVTLVEAPERVVVHLENQTNVACFGDATGALTIRGIGGVGPYEFSIGDGPFSPMAKFGHLAAGRYEVKLKDRNSCTAASAFTIVAANPPISITTSASHVSCFGESNGSVVTVVDGGVAPFSYNWMPVGLTGPSIDGLPAGTYQLEVTDAAGCRAAASVTLTQPAEPLTIQLATVPVCPGRNTGLITTTPSGGTPPYEFSINNGQTFHASASFHRDQGAYVIMCRDTNGCMSNAAAAIEKRLESAEPNFLVATKRHALDTLTVVDVSIPQPDSIHWQFPPQANVITNNEFAPQLLFPHEGKFDVRMTAFFQGCAYSVTKQLAIDPFDVARQSTQPGYKPIENVTVSPNPSSGLFEVDIRLNKRQPLTIHVVNAYGARVYSNHWVDTPGGVETINLGDLPAGIYLLRVIAESDAADIRIAINR